MPAKFLHLTNVPKTQSIRSQLSELNENHYHCPQENINITSNMTTSIPGTTRRPGSHPYPQGKASKLPKIFCHQTTLPLTRSSTRTID